MDNALADVTDPQNKEKEKLVSAITASSNTGRLDHEYCSDVDDPVATLVVGYPGTRVRHTRTGGQAPDDLAAGILTGYPGTRTLRQVGSASADADDPVTTVLSGYPGRRVSHTRTGGQSPDDPAAGFLTGFPGLRTARVHLGWTGGCTRGCPATRDAHRCDGSR